MSKVPRLVSTSDAARMLSVSPRTINRWAASGKLPAVDLPSGTRRFRLEDIQAIWSVKKSCVAEPGRGRNPR
ncbi:DNA binding domain protein, excisionase family OS=Tsukamurella paurometabola (strain ATCC 8368 / DSM / CCUG 35730 / CIP 100753 / JCM 10117 / KCTC 9821 /NBRC 16120 / NCIMB 702349 / NCTC 13040) OX=521096 GN=Tpau_3366 PE=4 SV=1 [Tsukamurella paurometabola]|uniref:DNA binding domain protein, excisionase family n=1 Tax=Tsukamurella paurometabola (strain ATCC 8368 / DSM 20162 / CCUG 35730 / CIP 100753 / JCM 10117 / KCTC 9821 / NBRC 16120 / NCIMB 702349 / NCTC 13040) TaxID=521096 RepID=D5UWF1_TSUPD|nr:helix-turn-helix domain-containing protein [Tsukamurella paurometabola]ADG79950.1 DNA binding domain protein, excisionase family [Tsukamurella paurometabola DSM 20162]SUP37781.1 DNA binding domain, excisionase family [Tsukamurella paurometabola]